MNARLLLLSTFLISGQAWAKAQIDVDVALSPAGDFVAHSETISGKAFMADGKVRAENIRVPLKSFKTGWETRDKHMFDYFNGGTYPDAVLVKAVGADGKGEGIFEANGVKQKASGTYVIEGNELVATFPLKVSDFKLAKAISYKGLGVEDEMKVKVRVPLEKGAPPAAVPKTPAAPAAAAPAKAAPKK